MMALTWEGTYIPPHSQAVTGIDNANTARSAVRPISGIDYSSDSRNFYRSKQVYFPPKFVIDAGMNVRLEKETQKFARTVLLYSIEFQILHYESL